MFDSRIPYKPSGNHGNGHTGWLPPIKGSKALRFSNGLTIAHDDASRACERYAKSASVQAHFSADGVTIDATGLSAKAVLAILGTDKKKPPKYWRQVGPVKGGGQPLRFHNGFSVSHSDESRACALFVKNVDSGKLDIGLRAKFSSRHGHFEGIAKNARKTLALLRG